MKEIIFDKRGVKGIIRNVRDVVAQFAMGDDESPWNKQVNVTDEEWIDEFVYEGYTKYGRGFIAALDGRFATVHLDPVKNLLFIARDWIGELPLHYLATRTGFYFGNTIHSIKDVTGADFLYENVRAFPQSQFQIIELNDIDKNNIAATFRPDRRMLYYDFEEVVGKKINPDADMGAYDFTKLSRALKEAVKKRSAKGMNYLLLSGGLDSLSVAVAMKAAGVPFETFTLSVDDKLGEAGVASSFSKKLGVRHYIVNVSSEEILSSYRDSIEASETFHLYNVYCAVGMLLLGKKLRKEGITNTFCGEAVNEAVGDYTDWEIFDPIKEKKVIIQKINTERLQNIRERTLYVWGHSIDKGKYNRQLGTGLAKHASSRMTKPFMKSGIALECPYYDRDLLSDIVALTPAQLKAIGYKPGLIWRILRNDFESMGFTEDEILGCRKNRLQDGGISSVLLEARQDQERTLATYNTIFKAAYNVADKSRTLLCTS
jgi:asparagine synthetase B (glutamine-hydrolysing)